MPVASFGCTDVAEPALLPARHAPRGFVGRDPSDERAQVLDERVVDGLCRHADRVVPVGDLPPELDVSVPFQCPGDGVQVDHHQDGVAGAFLTGFGVDDDCFIIPAGDDVRLARQR